MPARTSEYSAGFVLCSAHDAVIPKYDKGVIKTDLMISVPWGTYARIAPRSNLAAMQFIDVGAGVVDYDYRGNVGVVLFNHGNEDFPIKCGDRVAQLILERISMVPAIEVSEISSNHIIASPEDIDGSNTGMNTREAIEDVDTCSIPVQVEDGDNATTSSGTHRHGENNTLGDDHSPSTNAYRVAARGPDNTNMFTIDNDYDSSGSSGSSGSSRSHDRKEREGTVTSSRDTTDVTEISKRYPHYSLKFYGLSSGGQQDSAACASICTVQMEDASTVIEECVWLESMYLGPHITPREAAYHALIIGLEECLRQNISPIVVQCSNKLLLRHLTKQKDVRDEKLIALFKNAQFLCSELVTPPQFESISEEDNWSTKKIATDKLEESLNQIKISG